MPVGSLERQTPISWTFYFQLKPGNTTLQVVPMLTCTTVKFIKFCIMHFFFLIKALQKKLTLHCWPSVVLWSVRLDRWNQRSKVEFNELKHRFYNKGDVDNQTATCWVWSLISWMKFLLQESGTSAFHLLLLDFVGLYLKEADKSWFGCPEKLLAFRVDHSSVSLAALSTNPKRKPRWSAVKRRCCLNSLEQTGVL